MLNNTMNNVVENETGSRESIKPNKHSHNKPKRSDRPRKENGDYKRYNLILPAEVYEEIKNIAENKGTTVLEVLRKFIKLGFIVVEAEDSPNAEIILREEGETDKKLVLI